MNTESENHHWCDPFNPRAANEDTIQWTFQENAY